jgi:hypothetical protein
MAPIGMASGIGRFGVSGPANSAAPAGQNRVTSSQETPWYASGPFWVLVFLVVGYILVFQTLK